MWANEKTFQLDVVELIEVEIVFKPRGNMEKRVTLSSFQIVVYNLDRRKYGRICCAIFSDRPDPGNIGLERFTEASIRGMRYLLLEIS